MAVIDARPNDNYWHIVDVAATGQVNQNERARELRIIYRVDVRVSGSLGSWTGGDTRRFTVRVDGVTHSRDIAFDTRDGQDIIVVDVRQMVPAGDGRDISVQASFEGWSSSFPGFQDGGGTFRVAAVDPAPPAVSPPGPPVMGALARPLPTSFGVYYTRGAQNGAHILQDQLRWRRSDTDDVVWDDMTPQGYTNPTGGVGPELQPDTAYTVSGRSRNAAGWGPWGSEVSGRTLPGVRIKHLGKQRWAVPFVRFAGVYRMARPLRKSDASWRATA